MVSLRWEQVAAGACMACEEEGKEGEVQVRVQVQVQE
jgi:hypothetical protein